MERHLVHVETDLEPPTYVKSHPVTNLNALTNVGLIPEDTKSSQASFDFLDNVNILDASWPEAPGSSLDQSQVQALKRMLTKNIAIVQGPPGMCYMML